MVATKEEIKEIIKPHFGYLKLYLKWELSIDKVKEFHNITKTDKNIIKKLSKPLNEYPSYETATHDINKIKEDVNLKRFFKDRLNGLSRSFFKNTIDDPSIRKKYEYLYNNKQVSEMFFRTSSKPQSIEDYIKYIDDVISFDISFVNIVNRIENDIDYITAVDGAYVFKLRAEYLDMVPGIWCIYNDPEYFETWKESQGYDSIWLVVNPIHKNPHRRMVGVDIHKDLDTIEYMDSRNDRILDKDIPITHSEFFKIARNRIIDRQIDFTDQVNQDMLNDIIKARDDFFEEQNANNPYINAISDYDRDRKIHYGRFRIKKVDSSFEIKDITNDVIFDYADSYEEGEKYLENLLKMRGEL